MEHGAFTTAAGKKQAETDIPASPRRERG